MYVNTIVATATKRKPGEENERGFLICMRRSEKSTLIKDVASVT